MSPSPILNLPRELQDEILSYVSSHVFFSYLWCNQRVSAMYLFRLERLMGPMLQD